MASSSKASAALKSQATELMKQHFVYDVAGRVSEIYTAPTDQKNALPCSRVRYTYINPTSGNVSFMKEDNATWDVLWDEL